MQIEPHPPLSLRERKKELIRKAIRDCAERLFEERGFDDVTVAEIADAANISVKTLFTYIRSKEDLLFHDNSLIEAILKALRARAKDVPASGVVAETLIKLARERDSVTESYSAFQRGYGESEALKSRLARLWAEYEETLAKELASERKLDIPDADVRFEAAQLVILIRSTTWSEVHRSIAAGADPDSVFRKWLRKKARALAEN